MRISDWSSDVCSSDLGRASIRQNRATPSAAAFPANSRSFRWNWRGCSVNSAGHQARGTTKLIRLKVTIEAMNGRWRSRGPNAELFKGVEELGRAACKERVVPVVEKSGVTDFFK